MSATTPRAGGGLAGPLLLSWALAIGLLASLVWAGGVWNVLSISRLLDLLIESGVIQYHDSQLGWVPGLPDPELYLRAMDPIDWRLVLVCELLLFAVLVIRSLQFRGVLMHTGAVIDATTAGRAYLYGQSLNRWLPFNAGDIGTVLALQAKGIDAERTKAAVFQMRLLTLIEIAIFAIVGLLVLGWMPWLAQAFWALAIFGITWWFLRPHAGTAAGWGGTGAIKDGLRRMADDPPALTRQTALALAAFLLEHIAAFVLAMAFTSAHVLINIPFGLFLMALVAGSVARLLPITPGGLGLNEWGIAAALYLGGIGIPESVTAALMFTTMRYFVGFIVDLAMKLSEGTPNVGAVLEVLDGKAHP